MTGKLYLTGQESPVMVIEKNMLVEAATMMGAAIVIKGREEKRGFDIVMGGNNTLLRNYPEDAVLLLANTFFVKGF